MTPHCERQCVCSVASSLIARQLLHIACWLVVHLPEWAGVWGSLNTKAQSGTAAAANPAKAQCSRDAADISTVLQLAGMCAVRVLKGVRRI